MKKRRFTPAPILILCMVISGSSMASDRSESMDLFAAEYVQDVSGGKSVSTEGLHFLVDQPSLSLANFDFKLHEKELGVEITMTESQIKTLNKTMASYPDQRFAIVYEGQLIMSAHFKEPLTGKGLYLTFDSKSRFESFKNLLTETNH
jgi:preprotein translocase subunit SecD